MVVGVALMDIVTIDMETYYDRDYSLSKMTTEAYVRDPPLRGDRCGDQGQ